jgi:hypothetical protein
MSQVPFFIASSLLAWSVYLLGVAIYRLWFHPLAKFPGPKYAALSRWHEFYHDVYRQGKFIFWLEEQHKKYGLCRASMPLGQRANADLVPSNAGPIVRITPDEVHILDSDFWDTIFTKAGRVDKYD